MASIDTATRTQLIELYVAYFNRAPDASGLNYWAGKIANDGWTVAQVAGSFMDQAEVAAAYPAYQTTSEFIAKVYTNVLNRAADNAGKAYWTTQLNSGAVSKPNFIMAIVNAAKSTTGTAADAATLANKAAVGEYFAVTKGLNDTAAAATVMAGVTSDAASVTAAQTAVDNFASTGSTTATGTTYTLTANADSVAGTAGNDMIIATNTTLSSADRITGGNGSDELKLSSQAATNYSAFEMNGVETVTVTADNAAAQTFDMSGATGVSLLKTLNSTGDVTFNQVTAVSNVEVNNLTTGANVTVSFQDAAVSGSADTVALALANNTNTGVGTITLGRTGNANSGIETVAITTSGAATTVNTLNTNASTVSVAGSQNLTVTNALNNTVDTVSAGAFTGALNISLVGNVAAAGEGALSVTTGTGADTVNMTGVTRNATVSMGNGNDVLQAGMGDDTINMGAGNDRIDMAAGGLTVNDTINGGDGADTIRFLTGDNISKSEAEKVTAVETFDLRGSAGTYVITDNLLTSLSSGSDRFTVDTMNATGGHTIDLTNATFSNTNKFQLTAERDLTAGTAGDNVADNETVIANDATVNAKAVLEFGAGNADTLRVIDGATMTADDLANISGLEIIELQSASNVAQTWNIQLTDAFVRGASAANNDGTDGSAAVAATAAVAAGSLVIDIDNDVPAGSIVNIDTNGLTATLGANAVTVRSNANVTVNVTGTGAAQVNVVNSLRYTLNADNMTGTAGADTFIADSLSQVQTADSINGVAGADTLQLNFSLNNAAATALAQLNNTSIAAVQTLTFNTNNAIAFTDDGIASVTTINFGSGNDTVAAGASAATYAFGDGANSYTAAAVVAETITSGTGVDTFNFTTVQLTGADTITAGTGRDVLNLTDGAGAVYALMTATLSGIDTVNYTATNVADGLSVNNAALAQSEAGLQINVTDSSVANTAAIFNAGAVTTGNNVTVSVAGTGAGRALNAADVIGGAGNDTIAIGGTVTGYVVQGNAGADTINITTAAATGVLFNSPNDGGTTGANTGYDTVTGFTSGTDFVLFTNAAFAAANTVGTGAGANLVTATNAPANFTAAVNALVMTQAGTGFTNADLLDLSAVASRANTIGVTAAATQGGIIVAQGTTQSAVYLYVEQNGTANNISTTELKLLGVFDTNALGSAATDLQFA